MEDWRSVLHSPIFSVIRQRKVKEKENRAGANGEFSERMSHVASTPAGTQLSLDEPAGDLFLVSHSLYDHLFIKI
jgi:hypothetical protein